MHISGVLYERHYLMYWFIYNSGYKCTSAQCQVAKRFAVVSMRTIKGREVIYWLAAVTVKPWMKWRTGK